MEQEKIQTEYEEIDLMDYVKVLLKRKWLILSIVLVAVIATGVFSWFSPKVYKIDTLLEIGKIKGEAIEAPGEVIGKIKGDVYGFVVQEKLKIAEIQYPKVKTEGLKDTSLVKTEIESSDPKLAKDILEEINNLILEDHREIIKNQKELLENEIGSLENNTEILKKDIERIKTKIGFSEEEIKNLEDKEKTLETMEPWPQTDQSLTGSLFALLDIREKLSQKKQETNNLYLQNNSLEVNINDFKNQINSLRGQIENIKSTQIIKNPSISERPIKPRSVLNIVIAVILGIFVGVFLAFFQEWWEKNKTKLRTLDKGF
jgi:LPS O-antigen subunit length determinant protein (WzzB/FepE family)